MSTLHTAADGALNVLAAGGIINWGNVKNAEVANLLRGLASTLAIGFVIQQALSSRGAPARIIVASLSAAGFLWAVFNVTELKERVREEIEGAVPVVRIHVADTADSGAVWPAFDGAGRHRSGAPAKGPA